MKKLLVFVSINLISLHTALAQTGDEGASLGIKAGANISFYNLSEASVQTAPGYNLGLFSSVALSKKFSLQPEINLNIQNAKVTVDNFNKVQFNILLSYIEFTMTGRISFGKLFLQAGPYISYLANTSISNKIAVEEIVSRKSFYDIDYGFIYTAGIQLKSWDFGIRYNEGLFTTGKEKTSDGTLSIYRNNKTSMFGIFAGYYF